jgi:hypothetical protein
MEGTMATDNNKKRARRAGLTLNRYRDCLGASGPHDADRIRDLLQDILHWMAHQKPPNDYPAPIDTLREACDSACRDFPKEVAEEIDWAAFNRERGILIDKAVAGTITASEQKRLQEMQDFTDIYVERTAPRTYPDPQAKSK